MQRRQISLRSMMAVMALMPPLVALAVGAFGRVPAQMFWAYVQVIVWSILFVLLFATLIFLPTMALFALVEWASGLLGRRDCPKDRRRA